LHARSSPAPPAATSPRSTPDAMSRMINSLVGEAGECTARTTPATRTVEDAHGAVAGCALAKTRA
jgi:hypothetical protein